MSVNDVTQVTRFKVGSFTVLGILLIGVLTVFVNDRPYWWRGCNQVFINVEDATGLKTKSPVKSLGLQVGYLRSVQLADNRVKLGICVTAPIEMTPDTRAYIRGEGFLGDKFVELKPVKYLGRIVRLEAKGPSYLASAGERVDTGASSAIRPDHAPLEIRVEKIEKDAEPPKEWNGTDWKSASRGLVNFLISSAVAEDAFAQEPTAVKKGPREIPVGERTADMDKLMEKADSLMVELTNLSKNLKEGLDPKEIKTTLQQLNRTLENASKMLSPDGGLNTTARRALLKLEDAFEQIRQQATKINEGQGSVGKLLNDPVYADELMKALKAINTFLNKASEIRFVVTLGTEQIHVYRGSRSFFNLQIMPSPTRYYLVGVTIDPRGRLTITNTTTTAGGQVNTVRSEEIQEGGILFTAMLGKIFANRYDLSLGALYGDGAASAMVHLGPQDFEQMFSVRYDIYSRAKGIALNNRLMFIARPLLHSEAFRSVYIRGGLDSTRKVGGQYAWAYGAGVTFDDDDIKLLFSLAR